MITTPRSLRSKYTGRETRVFVPDGDSFVDVAAPMTEVPVDGVMRAVSSKILAMAITFNRDLQRRKELLHDCAVFALACCLDDPLQDTAFYHGRMQVGHRVRRRDVVPVVGDGAVEPAIPFEDALCITSYFGEPPAAGRQAGRAHVMVAASLQDAPGDTLYMSKFGAQGVVALHDLDAALTLYPATIAYPVDLSLRPPRQL